MKIKIEKLAITNSIIFVDFSTKYGVAVAQWIGAQPNLGDQYDVELEVDEKLTWGKNIFPITNVEISMSFESDLFNLVGEVVANEEDGCVVLAMGENVVLLDVENFPRDFLGLIKLQVPLLKIYPVDF